MRLPLPFLATGSRGLPAALLILSLLPSRLTAEPATPEPAARDPQASLELVEVDDGLTIELVAAEPLVADPVALDWGVDGSLWVAEMADYPYGVDNQGKPGGRIRRLRDTDGDGRYDRSDVFLEQLSFPTGVMAWRDGVLVTAAPELFFAQDLDGDGRADQRHVLFRGFVEGNQQLRVNGLRYGLDHAVYCAAGGHHAGFGADNSITLAVSSTHLELGSRDFQFDPDTGTLIPESGPSQFGRVRDDWNHWFGVQNSYPLWHYVLEDRYLRRNPRGQYPDPRRQLRLPANPAVFAISQAQQRYHSFEHAGHYTSACGPSIYRDTRLFPSRSGVTHAFTCEPFHNVVQHHELIDEGVSFAGRRAEGSLEHDFYASADPWSRPVMTRTGPDGALWVVDMYRYMIEHPDWLPPEGREDFRPFYRSGEDRGRIYRIYPADRPRPELPAALDTDLSSLVSTLASDNGWLRDKAQQLLIQSCPAEAPRQEAVFAELRRMASWHDTPRTRVHALYTLAALADRWPDQNDCLPASVLVRALEDPHPEIRRHALRLAEPRAADQVALQEAIASLVVDSHPKVRLQLALTLGAIPGRLAGDALVSLACDDTADRYQTAAIVSSAIPHRATLMEALVDPQRSLHPHVRRGVYALAGDNAELLAQLLRSLLPREGEDVATEQLHRCAEWLSSLEAQGEKLASLAERFSTLEPEFDAVGTLFSDAWQLSADARQADSRRLAALRLLAYAKPPSEQQRRSLGRLLRANTTAALQRAAIQVLGRDASSEAVRLMLDAWSQIAPPARAMVIDLLLAQAEGTRALLDRLEASEITPVELSVTQRDRLLRYRDKNVARRAGKVLKVDLAEDRAKVIATYRQALSLAPNARRGGRLFEKHCATCHLAQDGSPLGPQLHALPDRSPETLLVSILDPSRAVEPQYLSYQVELTSGKVLYGVIGGESGETLRLRQQDGTVHEVLRASIERLDSSRRSFMPDGFESQLTPQDLADIMRFVGQLKASEIDADDASSGGR